MERALCKNTADRRARPGFRRTATTLAAIALLLYGSACARRLTIRSEPLGADVLVNDTPVGKTPVDVNLGDMPRTSNIKIQLNKPDYGTFTGYIPGPTSATLSSEIDIVIPKSDDESEKLNKQMSVVLKAQKLALQKKGAEAVKLLDDSIKEYPRFTALHLAKANVLFLAKNYDGAITQYRKVLQLDPTNEEAIIMVAFFKKRSLAGNQSEAQVAAPSASQDPAKGVVP